MAISIVNNGPNGNFTPSSVIQWDSNNGPPFPAGWNWWIDLIPHPLPNISTWHVVLPFVSTGDQVRILAETRGQQTFGSTSLVDDAQTNLSITLRDNNDQVVDTNSINALWDSRSGLGVQAQILAQGTTDIPADIQQKITDTWTATGEGTGYTWQQFTNAVTGVLLNTPVGGIIAHPGLHTLSTFGQFDLEGRGSLPTLTNLGFVTAYGIAYQVIQHPAGWGVRDGFVQLWEERVVQFAALYDTRINPVTYVAELQNFHDDNFTWYWSQFGPNTIGYDVSPGCIIRCNWMVVE